MAPRRESKSGASAERANVPVLLVADDDDDDDDDEDDDDEPYLRPTTSITVRGARKRLAVS
jgi:hypothetical protein